MPTLPPFFKILSVYNTQSFHVMSCHVLRSILTSTSHPRSDYQISFFQISLKISYYVLPISRMRFYIGLIRAKLNLPNLRTEINVLRNCGRWEPWEMISQIHKQILYCFEDDVNFRQHNGKTWFVIRLKWHVPSTVQLWNLTAPKRDKLTDLFTILRQGIPVAFFSIN
jgi:hypothetical protein